MSLLHDLTTQEYIEVIHELEQENKVARVKDIADRRGVTRSSVSLVLNQLKTKELIDHEQYGHVTLSKKGTKLAKTLQRKHDTLKSFFTSILKVPENIANMDACKIEHDISAESLNAMKKMLEQI
jgi:DtxR family transcriptional regulator, Mn-dependent transcriptional regulator